MTCKHWRELDDDFGNIFEYCKGKRAKCTCSGEQNQCDYPRYFNTPNENFEAFRREDSITRGVAAVKPFLQEVTR